MRFAPGLMSNLRVDYDVSLARLPGIQVEFTVLTYKLDSLKGVTRHLNFIHENEGYLQAKAD